MSDTTSTDTDEATSSDSGNDTGDGTADLGDAGKRALDAERESRKAAEKANKDLQTQLDELKRSQMNDQEKAIDEAKAQARAEVLTQVGSKIAASEFKAAAAGRLEDDQLATLLAGLDLNAFLDADNDVDSTKVRSFIDGIAPAGNGTTTTRADLGQGARSQGSKPSDPLLEEIGKQLGFTP